MLHLLPTTTLLNTLGVPTCPWHTLPIFAETSNITGPFDHDAIQTLAKFPLFVAEKAYDYASPGFAEDKLAALAKELRAVNPAMKLVFYYNANLDLTDYELYNITAQHATNGWLRNSSGDVWIATIDSGTGARPPFPYNGNSLGGVPVYNFEEQGVRDAWVEECFTMQKRGYDGCLVDRWTRLPFRGNKLPPGFTKAAVAKWSAARDLATSTLAKRARAENVYLVGMGNQTDANSDPGYGNGVRSGKSLTKQLSLARAGLGLLASFIPTSEDKPAGTPGSWINQMDSFLIGAGEGHYFGAGSWTCNAIERRGVVWHKEYDMPLGKPLANGVKLGSLWTRSFAYGTNVSFDVSTGLGSIAWGAFPN